MTNINILENVTTIHYNFSPSRLINCALVRNEGTLSEDGALVVNTGKHTGRAAKDKFIVCDDLTNETVDWTTNQKFSPEDFDKLQTSMESYLFHKEIFVQDVLSGGENNVNVKVITTTAWHALFAATMFKQVESATHFDPERFTILHIPDFQACPETDSTNSETFIILNFTKKIVLIGGTSYAGEIKKSVFTILNFLLPEKNILPMHSSVSICNDNSIVFFGLSGTGKTTLSSDSNFYLVGDDEHGWDDKGCFNFEDGCYAKAIRLSEMGEPFIWKAIHSFGTVLENVAMNDDGKLDLNSEQFTENTRAAYKISKIPNVVAEGKSPHPTDIIMLTCDAYGVLPPLAKLTKEQAIYYFLSGYTAKIAGTEKGVKEPTAVFSTCFGAPFLPRHPTLYANLLLKKIEEHNVNIWLVNTGWVGGPYGIGSRMSLDKTREIIRILSNTYFDISNENHEFKFNGHNDEIFGFNCIDVIDVLPVYGKNPHSIYINNLNVWKDVDAFNQQKLMLAAKFKENFKKYESLVSEDIKNAGPK
jgi:phosphoenolpyruvate carboxykinase (ATP)